MNAPHKTNGKSRKLVTISQTDLPSGRKGKHHPMLVDVLEALQNLKEGRAIKVPLAEYSGSIADIRSAIHRATRKRKMDVMTCSDDNYFYVWKPQPGAATD